MDLGKALKMAGEGTAEQVGGFEKQLEIIYGVQGFDADGFTDFYGQDILTLNYAKADKLRQKWVDLLVSLVDRPRYAVFVRTRLRKLPQELRSATSAVGENGLSDAWIRVFEDLTPDKFVFGHRNYPVHIPGHVIESFEDLGGEVGHQRIKTIDVNHPSYVFAHSSHDLSGMSIEDPTPATLATSPGIPEYHEPNLWETHQGEVHESELDFKFLTANSIEEILVKLDLLDLELETWNHPLQAVMAENPHFNEWYITESQRK